MCPLYEMTFCLHTQQVFGCCGIVRGHSIGNALVEDVRQTLQTLFLCLALPDFEIGLFIILVGRKSVVCFLHVHIGLGQIALKGDKWTFLTVCDFHQDLSLLTRGDEDGRECFYFIGICDIPNANANLTRQPQGNLCRDCAVVGKGEFLLET